ncbi:DUF167 domain-containing protein [Arsenicibacter rosenii]|uniref:UPF0235 protein BLX24_23310 n=1 Tax=Arsenicibacter rosenii TaxID=1750698 RepID=A0A1S2VDE1_9BACT|nr:DUF167 domain-containing protein [Arsenicibacter rosenii]OIN56712.1 hypothetical protein BLX24_23310 [Arsenicibacter rosenii]
MQLHVKVKPGSKMDALFYDEAGLLNVKIKAPAQDGKANTYLTAFLAKQFGIPKSGVTILSGFTSQHKRLEIEAGEATIRDMLDSLKK